LVEVHSPKSTARLRYVRTFLVAIEENGRTVEFDYEDQNRISRIALPDARVYRIRYDFEGAEKKRIVRAFVTSPDGAIATFDIQPN
jgi:YD repeat-containing protein